jgi:pyruvate/2-oxoglutarate dehydrogenase complex dihydrolipoamide acyltransferase (E2) component
MPLALTKFQMPAMSPTMTEGGISTWKMKEGDTFAAGDIILEIETDKATMDVEAQDDGVMAKILVSAVSDHFVFVPGMTSSRCWDGRTSIGSKL